MREVIAEFVKEKEIARKLDLEAKEKEEAEEETAEVSRMLAELQLAADEARRNWDTMVAAASERREARAREVARRNSGAAPAPRGVRATVPSSATLRVEP